MRDDLCSHTKHTIYSPTNTLNVRLLYETRILRGNFFFNEFVACHAQHVVQHSEEISSIFVFLYFFFVYSKRNMKINESSSSENWIIFLSNRIEEEAKKLMRKKNFQNRFDLNFFLGSL